MFGSGKFVGNNPSATMAVGWISGVSCEGDGNSDPGGGVISSAREKQPARVNSRKVAARAKSVLDLVMYLFASSVQ
jgi:hypothetical protein